MAASDNKATERKKIIGGLLVGIGTYQLLGTLTLPELWNEALKHAIHVWWPLVLIAAGILWWVADAKAKSGKCRERYAGESWEARNGN